MSGCFVYTDKPVADSGSLTWTNEVAPIALSTSFNVPNNGDCSITDSVNDSYATAIDENETQYLSVLETTNDVTLEDLHNLTIGNPKLIEQENLQTESSNIPEDGDENLTNSSDQQIVIFNMEGSEDLYGIQFAQDEEGNMQKYQFQVRTNVDGQYEAIAETIQLLPPEENQASGDLQEDINKHTYESADENDKTLEEVVYETQVYMNDENTDEQIYLQNEENIIEEIHTKEENHTPESSETVFVYIKSEATAEKHEINDENEIQLEEPDFEPVNDENVEENNTIDVKPGLLEASLTTNIKQEYNMQNQLSQEVENQNEIIYEADDLPEGHSQEILSQKYHSEDAYDADEGTILEYRHFDTHNTEEICEGAAALTQQQPHEGLFTDVGGSAPGQGAAENDSDSDSYEMEDRVHVTAEGDFSGDSSSADYQTLETVYQEDQEQEQTDPSEKEIICPTNILKQPTNANSVDNFSNKTILYYMITNADQKENVITVPLTDSVLSVKPNPRSLLKNETETAEETNCFLSHPETTAPVNPPRAAKQKPKDPKKSPSQKRSARSSEVAHAKLFNSFIDKTTIAQAPVRQVRLPRKQEIRPVDTRRDEEIIVKEVMVSARGFVEDVSERFNSKDKLEVTSIVELTDSEEERAPRRGASKKQPKAPRRPLVDDGAIIEILQSDEEAEGQPGVAVRRGRGRPRKSVAAAAADGPKRPRGRPPKGATASPQKRTRGAVVAAAVAAVEVAVEKEGKPEFVCPHCPKSLPSANSLATHIQHHSLEASLSLRSANTRHRCAAAGCGAAFKNAALLQRHACPKAGGGVSPRPRCAVCARTFDDAAALDVHKRAHLKEGVVRSTATATVSPRKFKMRAAGGGGAVGEKFKSPRKVGTTSSSRCKLCPKVCPNAAALAAHERAAHRGFACTTCAASFPSRLLLDTHVRISCVKAGSSPKDRRLSFKVRKQFVSSPARGRLAAMGRAGGAGGRSGSRLSVVTNRTSVVPKRTSVVTNRTSAVPKRTSVVTNRTSTVSKRTSVVPKRTSVVPNKIPAAPSSNPAVPIRTQTAPIRTREVPIKTAAVPIRTQTAPIRTPAVPIRTAAVPIKTPAVPSRTLAVPTKAAVSSRASEVPSSGPEKSSGALNKTSSGIFSKPIDMKLQCSLCQMKFSTMTALFKHEVREHNVNTPDKNVLLPDKKLLHKPLHEHGGIPIPCRLNKFFQGFRKKLENDSTADVTVSDNAEEK